MQDATRQGKILSFFLMKRKENCARKIEGGEIEGRGRGEGEYLTFFKGIINSLSALVDSCNDSNTGWLFKSTQEKENH